LFFLDTKTNTVTTQQHHQYLTTLEKEIKPLKSNHDDQMREEVYAVQEQMKNHQQKTEETLQRMEANVENAFKKVWEVQKSNEEL